MGLADDLLKQAAELRRQGEAFIKQADALVEAATKIRATEGTAAALHTNLGAGMLGSNVDTAARAAIGKQFASKMGKEMSPLAQAAHAANHSLRSLAEACGIPHSYLSQMAKGDRPVSDEIRAKVESLTGFTAWPERKTKLVSK